MNKASTILLVVTEPPPLSVYISINPLQSNPTQIIVSCISSSQLQALTTAVPPTPLPRMYEFGIARNMFFFHVTKNMAVRPSPHPPKAPWIHPFAFSIYFSLLTAATVVTNSRGEYTNQSNAREQHKTTKRTTDKHHHSFRPFTARRRRIKPFLRRRRRPARHRSRTRLCLHHDRRGRRGRRPRCPRDEDAVRLEPLAGPIRRSLPVDRRHPREGVAAWSGGGVHPAVGGGGGGRAGSERRRVTEGEGVS